MRPVLALAAASALLAVSPAAAGVERPRPLDALEWTSYGHDSQLTNRVPSTTIGERSAGRLEPRWHAQLDAGVLASPLSTMVEVGRRTRQLVFVSTTAASVYALDGATGDVLWSRTFGTVDTAECGTYGISSTGAIDVRRGLLYVVSADGELRGLDLATGADAPGFPLTIVDRRETEYVWGGLRIVGDRLYVPVASYCDAPDIHGVAAEGRIVAIDLDAVTAAGVFDTVPGYGNLGGVWGWGGVSAERDGSVVYTAIGNSYVFDDACECFVDDAGYGNSIVALAPDLTRVLGANRPAGVPTVGDSDFGAAPLLFRPRACPPLAGANNKQGVLYLWDREHLDAGPRVTFGLSDAQSPFVGSPAWDPVSQRLFESQALTEQPATGNRYGVRAIDVVNGCNWEWGWQATFGTGVQSPPIVVGDVVFAVGGFSGGFAAFAVEDGARLWSFETPDATLAPLASAGGAVFGADLAGNVYSFAVPR